MSKPSTILVTGGAGFIGSHTVLELLNNGDHVVVLDNLCNSSVESLRRVEKLSGCELSFVRADICCAEALDALFTDHQIDAVIHFAALKAVGESVEQPLLYYQNNLEGLLSLLGAMQRAGVYKLIFSSSATVYGDNNPIPYLESMPLSATSPYGRSKVMCEQILMDMTAAEPSWQIIALRYFNPVGAHPSGEIGEDPRGKPNNLMPYIAQVAVGRRERLTVFGDDYPTRDGTGVRDYIHVCDLARGHLAAVAAVTPGYQAVNLGAGVGHSVFEVVEAFERACGASVPYQVEPRRAGDIAEFYAHPGLAKARLKWQAELSLEQMCADSWRFQQANPNGYED
ncbi:MAG: UDP-glucose 4-epimerase GalE [Porticoccaceae bacterium]